MSLRMGIDLGGTKTEIIVLDEGGLPVFRRRVDTPAREYASILKTIGELVAAARRATGDDFSIGIGIPGAISPQTGLLRNSNTACLNGRPFRADLPTAPKMVAGGTFLHVIRKHVGK